MSSLVKVT